MLGSELQQELFEKMWEEQESFKAWMLTLEPEDLFSTAYAYVIREGFLSVIEEIILDDNRIKALLATPNVLSDLFDEFTNIRTDHKINLRHCVEDKADSIMTSLFYKDN